MSILKVNRIEPYSGSSVEVVGLLSSSVQIELQNISGSTFANREYTFPNNLTVGGSITALNTVYVSSSVLYESGSTKFGDSDTDTHQFTGSIRVSGSILLNNIDINNYIINNNSYTESINLKLNKLEIESASVRTDLNVYTQSANLRLGSLELESSSIRIELNSYTSSNDVLNTTQTDRIDKLSLESGSIRTTFNLYTQSTDNRLNNLELTSESVNSSIFNLNSFTASATYYKEAVSESNSYTINHNLNEDLPIVQVYDTDKEQVIPYKIKLNSVNQILVEFTTIFSGSVVVKV